LKKLSLSGFLKLNFIEMKGTSLIVSIVLFIAVVVLYILHFTGEGKNEHNSLDETQVAETTGSLKIAYVKADSVILNFDLSQDLHDDFTKKQEAYTSEYGKKRQSFEKEAAAFQEKLQRGGFLTEQRAVQERDRLVSREQEILKLDQDLSTKLGEMQAANNQQILDSLMNYLNIYNKDKKYDYIFNAANILIGKEADNIGKGQKELIKKITLHVDKLNELVEKMTEGRRKANKIENSKKKKTKEELLEELTQKIKDACDRENYEEAARIRDYIIKNNLKKK